MWYVLRRQADVCVLSSWASGPGHACQSTRTCVSANPLTSVIVKRSASLFCKGPGGTYLRLCGPDGLCCNYSALLQMINKWVDMTMFQSKHTYKIVGGGWAPCHHLPPPPPSLEICPGPLLTWCLVSACGVSIAGIRGHREPPADPQDILMFGGTSQESEQCPACRPGGSMVDPLLLWAGTLPWLRLALQALGDLV